MKNIKTLINNAIIAKEINKSVNSKALGCVAIAGVLGFTLFTPVTIASAAESYVEKVIYDASSKVQTFSSLEDAKSKSTLLTYEKNPEFYYLNGFSNTYKLEDLNLPLDGKYYYTISKDSEKDFYNMFGGMTYKVIEMYSRENQFLGYKIVTSCIGDTIFGDTFLGGVDIINDQEYYISNYSSTPDFFNKIEANLASLGIKTRTGSNGESTPIQNPTTPVETPTTPTQPTTPVEVTEETIRLGGSDRYDTAMEIAKNSLNGGKMKNVILASGMDFPDSLSASALSSKYDAPILLAKSTGVGSEKVLNFIKDNLEQNGQVIIVGGEGVIDSSVVSMLNQKGITKVKRLAGKDRYATNKAIIADINPSKGGTIFVASSYSYADALSVSSVSAKDQSPIILSDAKMSDYTKEVVNSLSPSTVYIIGGEGVISKDTENYLKSKYNVVRLGGANRYETCKLVLNKFKSNDMNSISFASSVDFPDALAGSYLAYKTNSMILLVNGSNYNMYKDLLPSNVKKLYAFGGSSVVPNNVVEYYKN